MSCTITFRGNLMPAMTWTVVTLDGRVTDVPSINAGTSADVEAPNPSVQYTIVSTATLTLTPFHEGAKLSCLTLYLGPLENIDVTVRNDAEYSHTFTSGAISVHCKYVVIMS